jgi:MAPEG family
MQLDSEQRLVLSRMVGGLLCAIFAITLGLTGVALPPIPEPENERLSLLAAAGLMIALPLFISIARLAKQRFFTPDDFAGAGFSGGTDRARMLQALLQNTLEQTLLAFLAYCAWMFLAPAGSGALPALASLMFVVGRIIFFAGYAKGGGSRAFGFTLTFYPTVGMILSMLPFAVLRLWP